MLESNFYTCHFLDFSLFFTTTLVFSNSVFKCLSEPLGSLEKSVRKYQRGHIQLPFCFLITSSCMAALYHHCSYNSYSVAVVSCLLVVYKQTSIVLEHVIDRCLSQM